MTPISKLFGSSKGPTGPSDSEGDSDDEGLTAAKAILSAIKAGDAEALDLALEDHYKSCQSEGGAEESGSDDGED